MDPVGRGDPRHRVANAIEEYLRACAATSMGAPPSAFPVATLPMPVIGKPGTPPQSLAHCIVASALHLDDPSGQPPPPRVNMTSPDLLELAGDGSNEAWDGLCAADLAEVQVGQAFQTYVSKLLRGDLWGGECELWFLASRTMGLPVCVVSSDDPSKEVASYGPPREQYYPIATVAYNGRDHYDAAMPNRAATSVLSFVRPKTLLA